MSQNVWATIMPFGPVTLIFYWPKKKIFKALISGTVRIPESVDLQLSMQSVPITTDVVNSNIDQGEVYNIM
jgi:hypothetical protein